MTVLSPDTKIKTWSTNFLTLKLPCCFVQMYVGHPDLKMYISLKYSNAENYAKEKSLLYNKPPHIIHHKKNLETTTPYNQNFCAIP